jgi:hypothetical protein
MNGFARDSIPAEKRWSPGKKYQEKFTVEHIIVN